MPNIAGTNILKDIALVAGNLLDTYDQTGGFGQTLRLCPIKDELFTKRDWWIVFKRVPRLRLSLLLSAPLYFFSRRESVRSGFCAITNPKNPLSLRHQSFFNDLLVWEALWEARPYLSPELSDRVLRGCEKTLGDLRGHGIRVNRDEFSIEMFSYFSPVEYVTKRNAFFRFLIRVMDFAVPDNDTTSIVYSACAGFASKIQLGLENQWKQDWETFVRFLGEHVYKKGRFAQGVLNYENGVDESDRGVYTWILEENNEVDATTNINILSYLAAAFPFLREDTKKIAASISAGIFHMLARHATEGRLASLRFQQYYPPGVALFFWHRFSILWSELTSPLRSRLDPSGKFDVLNIAWKEWAKRTFSTGSGHYNFPDLIWSAPFLAENGDFNQIPNKPSPSTVLADSLIENADYIHVLYPVRLICLTRGVPHAAYLRALVIEAGMRQI